MIYPKDIRENLIFRNRLVEECLNNPRYAQAIKMEFGKDILFAFNVFFWTHDTRTEEKDLPFITYDFQDEAILKINKCIEKGENVFIDKSRDMGATYIILYVYLWRWLTKKGELFRVGSWKEQFVDVNGDMSTLFEKLRYCLFRLPKFLMPYRFIKNNHCTYMRLINPENKCSIIGEATSANFARSSRAKSILLDEFQTWDNGDSAWRSATDSTPSKIALGTPLGSGNKFAELSRTEEVRNKIRLMWTKHPKKVGVSDSHIKEIEKGEVYDRVGKYKVEFHGKTEDGKCYIDQFGKLRSDWYDRQHLERDGDDIAQNIDCSYLTTGQPVFDVLICDKKLRECQEPLWIGNFHWTKNGRPIYGEFGQLMNRGKLEVEFVQHYTGMWKIWEKPIDGWDNGYSISADVALGLEQGDFNSASVLRRFPKTGEALEDFKPMFVASFHGHMRPEEYQDELWKAAIYYKQAWVAPEITGLGHAVVVGFLEKYPKIYHKEVMTKGYPESTDKLGFDTNNKATKGIVVSHLSKAISMDDFIDYDEGFWKETMTFVNDDGKLEAQGKSRGEKCFDDRVMNRVIGWWVHSRLPNPTRKRETQSIPKWKQEYFGNNGRGLLRFAVR